MKLITRFALLAALFFFSCCTGKTAKTISKTDLLAGTTWKFEDLTSPTPDAAALAALEQKKAFLVDQKLTFNEDKSYSAGFALATDSTANTIGTWEISEDQAVLIIITNEVKLFWTIGRLDESIFELKTHDTSLDIDVRYVYKRNSDQ